MRGRKKIPLAVIAQRDAERSYGVAEDELTPSLNWSAYSLHRDYVVIMSEDGSEYSRRSRSKTKTTNEPPATSATGALNQQ